MKLKSNGPLAKLNPFGFHKPDAKLVASICDELKKHVPKGTGLRVRAARRHCLRHNGLEAALIAIHFDKILVLITQFPERTTSRLEDFQELLKQASNWSKGVLSYETELARFDLKNCNSFETPEGWLISLERRKKR
jgi:hypothetical protein